MRGRQERHITGGADARGTPGTDGRRSEWAGPGFPQLKVPGSPTTTGADPGDDIMPPPSSQHGAADGPQAGAHAGSPQAGAPQAGAIGRPEEHGERNSMNDGRRQLLAPPKQLLHPGAAARLPRMIARHTHRDMFTSPPLS
jgi:hypothetical protein